MGWRSLGIAALVAGTLSAEACGGVSCTNGVTVRAPEELADPSAGHVSVNASDMGVSERFDDGAHSLRTRFTDMPGQAVSAVLVMPDGTRYSGGGRFTERRVSGGETCIVAVIELELEPP